MGLYAAVCRRTSGTITHAYSTSFSWGIRALAPRYRDPIRGIYAFVRLADEVVDTFHGYDKAALLSELREQTALALERGISTNPILHSFQRVVRQYAVPHHLIDTFLDSMAVDLDRQVHDAASSDAYITGSARCVGSMCLAVFCDGDPERYAELDPYARSLGSAFQKINFLRDLKADQEDLGRLYFPGLRAGRLTPLEKKRIEDEIIAELEHARIGIRALPIGACRGVALACAYYAKLFERIRALPPEALLRERIRVHNVRKLGMLFTHLVLRPSL